MSEQTHDAELTDFEAALKTLAPAAAGLSRDVLLFRAGQASLRRRSWFWPSATLAFAGMAVTLGFLWQQRPHVFVVDRLVPQPVERIVYIPSPAREPNPLAAESQEAVPVVQTDYLRLRDQVLRWGVDALPALPTETSSPAPAGLERPRLFDDAKNSRATGDRS